MSDTTGSGSQGPDGEPTGDPYGQPPAYPPPPPQHNPYGAPEREQPPGPGPQPPPPAPYGQQAGQQFGQPYPPSSGQHPGAEYGAQYGQAYGAPHGQSHVPDRRPGTVTAAGVITLIFSGITGALFALGLVALGVAREQLVNQLRDEPGLANIDPNDIVSVMLVLFLVLVIWCIAAMVLAVFAMRRSNGARIGLVVSSAGAAVLALLGIGSGVSAITLVAAVAVIICLFAGGARQWYAGGPGSGPRTPRASGPVA